MNPLLTLSYENDDGEPQKVTCQRVTRELYQRFQTMTADPTKVAVAAEWLFLKCVDQPTAQEAQDLLKEYPALGDVFGLELLAAAGSGAKVSKAKEGGYFRFTAELGEETVSILARKPTQAEWAEIRTLLQDKDKRATVAGRLLAQCLVQPDMAGLEALLARYPALEEPLGDAVSGLAMPGVDKKKLRR